MTETEKKALALLNEVRAEKGMTPIKVTHIDRDYVLHEALCRAIEQHEAFKQEVSDVAEACQTYTAASYIKGQLNRFIIAKPDPLVEAWKAQYPDDPLPEASCANLRAAIEKCGGKIVWGEG